jgi:hypothetical protein
MMIFSKKQKVVIWATLLLALFFLGLKGEEIKVSIAEYWRGVYLYGMPLGFRWEVISGRSFKDALWGLAGSRQYVISAILLIGLTAVITSKKK